MKNDFQRFSLKLILLLIINSIGQNLIDNNITDINNALVLKSTLKFSLIIALLTFSNFLEKIQKRNFINIVIAAIIWTSSLIIVQNENVSILTNFFLLISCILVATFEELLFRKLLFKQLQSKFIKVSIFTLIVIASFIFAIAHLFNLLKFGNHLYSVINQIFFAFGIGIVLQYIFYKYKNLLLCIIIHSLINYFGTYKSILYTTPKNYEIYTASEFITTFIFIGSLNLFIVLIILLLLKIKHKPKY